MNDRSAENRLLVAALSYAKRGWHVLPCKPGEKRPMTEHGYKSATTEVGELIPYWKRRADANVAIATGSVSGILVLDVDPRNGGDESLARLEAQHGPIPETLVVQTGGGGRHFYFAAPDKGASRSHVLADGLDVKGDRGYVVAPPSVHPEGGIYRWKRGQRKVSLAPAPAWLLRPQASKKRTSTEPIGRADHEASETPLGRLFGDCGLLGKRLDEGRYAVVCPWQDEHSGGKPFDTSTVIFPASVPGGIGGFHCAHSHCVGRSSKQAFDALLRRADTSRANESWMLELSRNKEGRILRSFRNVCLVLQHDPAYNSNLRFDEMRSTVLLGEDEMRDSGISAIRIDLDKRYDLPPSEADAVRAVQYVAEQNRVHPVRTFLKRLKWDGCPRIDRVCSDILRVPAKSEGEMALLRLMVRKWFISAVARPLQPGIKVDAVLILVGAQGGGKSTFFRILGGEWFSDTEMALDKDGLMQLGGSWIYEWAELENVVGRNTTSRVKQFVTSDRDRFRPPFGRTPITVLRTSVIVGTTNLDSFLHDPTGSRRFWVIPVGAVNAELLREWREQLLAEAVDLYRRREQHWLTEDEELQRQEFVGQFNETDPWEEPILEYLNQQSVVRIADVLHEVLSIPVDRQSRREDQRVAAVMRRNGWKPDQRRIDGRKLRIWERCQEA